MTIARSLLAGSVALMAASLPSAPAKRADALQFAAEPVVTIDARNVGRLRARWRVALPEAADSAPLFVSDVGGRNLVIIETQQGRVLALDAETGQGIWQTNPPPGDRYTTSSPAVDPERTSVYAYALDGYIHKYTLADGSESTGDGWPQLVTAKGDVEKGSSPIRIFTAANGHTYLSLPTAGYPDPFPGDEGDYQGHVTTVDLADGTQKVFNAACSDKAFHLLPTLDDKDCFNLQSGIWARAGAVYDPGTDRLFVTIGNGVFDGHTNGFNWGSSVVALRPDGGADGGTPVDSYTPLNFQELTDKDLDLSSSTIEILPQAGEPPLPHLGVQIGKDGVLRLLNLADLSGQGGPRHLGGELQAIPVLGGFAVLTRPVAWLDGETTRLTLATHRGAAGFSLQWRNGQPLLVQDWQRAQQGSSPAVANGVMFYASKNNLMAVDARTGTTLWTSSAIGNIHWQSPVLAGSSLFLSDDDGYLNAYAVGEVTPRLRSGSLPRQVPRVRLPRN
jgi:outer membrane protein assembly factor BamB